MEGGGACYSAAQVGLSQMQKCFCCYSDVLFAQLLVGVYSRNM